MVTQAKFDFLEYAAGKRARIEARLEKYLAGNDPPELWEAMRYSVLSGGKRLRALLCLASAEAAGCGRADELVMPCACAIELIHAFSLIHDDLPAMDNDDFRRGRPTNHKMFGEATAILAGDALFALAVEILVSKTPAGVDQTALSATINQLVRAAGADGMVGGQVADMNFTGQDPTKISPAALELMHQRKTGALIRFSAWSGACLAGAGQKDLELFGRFGEILGLAFQIADDLLDVTGDKQTLGKTPGKDEAAGKATWVSCYGLTQSRARLSELEAEGRDILAQSGLAEAALAPLNSLLQYAIHRPN